MAIRVVKKEPAPEVLKQCVCRQCGATLEYSPIDVKKYEARDFSGGPDGRTWIVCPECNSDVTLSSW